MQACTTISKRLLVWILLAAVTGASAFAQGGPPAIPMQAGPAGAGAPGGPEGAPAVPPKKEDTGLFDGSSPYLDYGDFNLSEEENEDTLYFQYGRYFGLSLGLGYQTATGNRGKLYEAAIPRFDARIVYWFGFHFAADLGVFFANHSFYDQGVNYAVKMIGYGFHLKYYFDVKNASAPVSFANPYLIGGAGAISKSQSSLTQSTPDTDSTMSVDFGAGLEFPIVFKKTYLALELLYHTQSFQDTLETRYEPRVPDLSGGFLTLGMNFMFVW
jgi:hypothetical protein